jgi:hypothetical protein
MRRDEELRIVVEGLISVLHEQARHLERLTEHVSQAVGRLEEGTDFSVVRSELSALHVRAKKLVAAAREPV